MYKHEPFRIYGDCLKAHDKTIILSIQPYKIKKFISPFFLIKEGSLYPEQTANLVIYTSRATTSKRFNPELRIFRLDFYPYNHPIYTFDKSLINESWKASTTLPRFDEKYIFAVDFDNKLIRICGPYAIGGWVRF